VQLSKQYLHCEVLMPDTQIYSASELGELANELDNIAAELPTNLPGEDGLSMMRWSLALGGAASNLRLMQIRDYIAQTAVPLQEVIHTTSSAKEIIKTIQNVQKTIEIVGDVMLIATAIWLQKWPLILPALKELKKDVNS